MVRCTRARSALRSGRGPAAAARCGVGKHNEHELRGSSTFSQHLSPDDVVDADDAVGPGGPRVVDDGEVALHPHPAARLRQEAVVLGARLALVQHCKKCQSSILSAQLKVKCDIYSTLLNYASSQKLSKI